MHQRDLDQKSTVPKSSLCLNKSRSYTTQWALEHPLRESSESSNFCLFRGIGSVGRAFKALGWEVTSLDLEGEPTIRCDILDWDHTAFPPGHFQVVWASPVCCEFSKALTRRPRRLDSLVLRTLELINYFKRNRRAGSRLYCSRFIHTRRTVFPEADGAHSIPLLGVLQTTMSRGCLTS